MTSQIPAGSSVTLDHLAAVHAEWKRLQAEADKWQALADQMKKTLQTAVGEAREATIGGITVVTYKPSGQFSAKRFTADHPDLAVKYTVTREVLDTDTLAKEQPDLYTAYRARRFERKG
ncbi:hypothetical protein ACQEVZ_20170 [Dactylosporangium sp. CA-152071]|uniref:hypothetical protein n=1 Tax=Dactylosporangium sp. CA-152071 TaxID=3239933 RepID=UPI003D9337A7